MRESYLPEGFDCSRVKVHDSKLRESRLHVADMPLDDLRKAAAAVVTRGDIDEVAMVFEAIRTARQNSHPVIAFIGGHVIKCGMGPYLAEMMRSGWITHLAGNGSVMIHDAELATVGHTSEDVQANLPTGQFGAWSSIDAINVMVQSLKGDEPLGSGLGDRLCHSNPMSAKYSVLSAGFKYRVPVTIHPTLGADVNCLLPSFAHMSQATAAWQDLLIFAAAIRDIEQGVYLSFGSAVASPELFLKALSAARNALSNSLDPRLQLPAPIKDFKVAVFDVQPLPWPMPADQPVDESNPWYYYRPMKTLLTRVVGPEQSYYVRLEHTKSIRALYSLAMT